MLEVLEEDRQIFDDLLWLRFLEVENNFNSISRESKKFKKLGTTPFTLTKRLTKEEDDENYGFELHFSKPPTISKILKNSPAEKIHMEVGDFIVFVNQVNVVSAEVADIVNLMKNNESVLFLEIFRKAKMQLERVVTIESESSSVPNESNESKESTNLEKNDLNLNHKIIDSRKKHLTFKKDESSCSSESQVSLTNKLLQNFIVVEKKFLDCLVFGDEKYIRPLKNRKDLLNNQEYEILFGNIERLKAVMEKIYTNGERNNVEAVIRSYKKEFNSLITVYESYFSVLNVTDAIIVDKTHQTNFIKFIASEIPTNQPLFHSFVQKPFEFYNDLQKHFQLIMGQFKIDSRNYKEIQNLLQGLVSLRERNESNESKIEINPFLKMLKSKIVFVKCIPFSLDGKKFIFAGDLIRVEKEKEFPVYCLLFNDILIFSTINRDRVLFIYEEPISLKCVTESFFNIRKKENEFRLLIETNPNYKDLSPTTRCYRSPLREQSKKKTIILRAHSEEIKKIWQNLISQSIFKIHNSVSENSFLDTNVNVYTKEASSTKTETEIFRSPKKQFDINDINQQLGLKVNINESFEKQNDLESVQIQPSTPVQKSFSFGSLKNLQDFECDFFEQVCNESIFDDTSFFADDS